MSGEPFHAAAAEARNEPLYLEALGSKFALGPGPDAITWLELAAASGVSRLSRQGSTAYLNFAKCCFTEESWPLFYAAVREHGITDFDDLEEIVGEAVAIIEGRPTMPSSSSEAGSSSTSQTSTESSSATTLAVAVS